MQTKPKSNSIITHTLREDGAILFHVKGCEDIVFDPARVSEPNRLRAMRHGFVQRISDAAAIPRDTTNGQPALPSAKRAAMARLADHYLSGAETWAIDREGGGPGLDGTILAAVAEATGRTVEQVRTMVAEGCVKREMKPGAYLNQLATAKAVVPILARMRAAQSTVNADEELDAMMAQADDEGDDDAPDADPASGPDAPL